MSYTTTIKDAVWRLWCRYKKINPEPSSSSVGSVPLFSRHPSGWVMVNIFALAPPPEKPLLIEEITGTLSPAAANVMLCNKPGQEVFNALIGINYMDEVKEYKDDLKRGLTVASAFFDFLIPESLVLIDRRTCIIAELFANYDQDRKTVDGWVDTHEFFREKRDLIAGFEKKHEQLSAENACNFYYEYHGAVAEEIFKALHEPYFPHISAFVDSTIRKVGLSPNCEIHMHLMFVTAIVVARVMEIQVPMHWVLCSPSIDAVTNAAKYKETQRPKLTLVSKNQEKEKQ